MRKRSLIVLVALCGSFLALGGVGVAANGDNLILGKADNSAGAKTGVSASINDRALQLTNTNTNSSATALGLTVASGHPPLLVNSSAGKATYLNVDKLDGLDAAGFWKLGGNGVGSTGILGTTTNQPLDLRVNGQRVLRLQPSSTSPDLTGGWSGNAVLTGAYGATISGGGSSGHTNQVSDNFGTVSGGRDNLAGSLDGDPTSASSATVGGGTFNTASGASSALAGGASSAAFGDFSAVAGGYFNVAIGNYSAVGGGAGNTATGPDSTVAGGSDSKASGGHSVVAGGFKNTASGSQSAVAGGDTNTASGPDSAVAGGFKNTASGSDSAVAGGAFNTASGNYSLVGGTSNTASGHESTVAGGAFNTASGSGSFAAGFRAVADDTGSFVWSDGNWLGGDQYVYSYAANSFSAHATGGFNFWTNQYAPTTGCWIAAGGGSINCSSSRRVKKDFAPVDRERLLQRLAQVPVTTWSYKHEKPQVRHIGPMAQDFKRAFRVGEDDTSIAMVDADGVSLAAIQGLYRENQALERRNEKLTSRLATQNARLTKLEREVAKLSR